MVFGLGRAMKPTTPAQAQATGAVRYFTGRPCPKGHVCDRMVANTNCLQCIKLRAAKKYRENAGGFRERHKARKRAAYWRDVEKSRRLLRERYWLQGR